MATPRYEYLAHHPLQRNRLAKLTIRDATWTEAVNGGSTFSFKVTVPEDPFKISEIRQATQPDESAIYIRNTQGDLVWGGIVTRRIWNNETSTLSISVLEWRAWMFQVIVGPKPDLTGTNQWSWTNIEQFQIARDIVGYATAEGTAGGVPFIYVGAEASGVVRSMVVMGTSFKTAGEYLDGIATQDSGFEWDIEPFMDSDGNPSLKLALYSPERGGPVEGLTFQNGRNMLNRDDLEESTESRATRVWAVGEGPNAESLPYAVDDDPGMSDGFILRKDKASQYRGMFNRTVLASYARAERSFLANPLGILSFTTLLDAPDINSYAKGDRCRVVIRDRFIDIDVSNARILERQISPMEGGGVAKITVNLNDSDVPELDEGGSV